MREPRGGSNKGTNILASDYKNFAGKRVARTITEWIESGTELQATITELSELKSPDESQFAIETANRPLQTIRTDEQTLRSLAMNSTDIVWPTVRSGAVTGTLSLYVCVDRTGRVREVYELNAANLGDEARDIVRKWQFKPAITQGVPVQVESILTFAFNTKIADPIPELNEEEGLKLLVHRVEPVWPAGFAPLGTPVIVSLGVRENGDCYGIMSITSDAEHKPLVMKREKLAMVEVPLRAALEQWRFQPYVRDGKATEYHVTVTFYVK